MSSYNFKVVLLGQGCVGKTSLVLRYVSNVFGDSHQSTLQASFLRKQLYLEKDWVRLDIWDTAGQEKFHALGPIYYREANGALLVYDVTCPDSLRKVCDWIKELNKMVGTENIRLAIVGNKVDLLPASEQKSPKTNAIIQEAMKLTEGLTNAKHYVTSAKISLGIEQVFVSLSQQMIEQHKKLAVTREQNALTSCFRSQRALKVTEDEDGASRGRRTDKTTAMKSCQC